VNRRIAVKGFEVVELLFNKLKKIPRLALLSVMLLAACVPAASQSLEAPSQTQNEAGANPQVDSPTQSPSPSPTDDLGLSNIPFVPLLPRDAIRPVYEPDFVSAADSPLQADELVMGVAIKGEAKAYPVSVLRFREMVNDELGGLPILVTW
jgi:hypothetical protein